jgi:Mlc titration factor MtfA (ptsG expression regulator)
VGIDQAQQMPRCVLNFLQVRDKLFLPRGFGILLQQLAVPNDLVNGCAQFVPELRQRVNRWSVDLRIGFGNALRIAQVEGFF